jgi:hypothetical protein
MTSTTKEKRIEEPPSSPRSFFEFLTQRRSIVLFLAALPILWVIFIAIGWSKDDKVEESVYNIWTRQRSSFNQDKDYATEYDRGKFGLTSFAALAVARDDENLFTPLRLEEIRKRMEETEGTTVSAQRIGRIHPSSCLF